MSLTDYVVDVCGTLGVGYTVASLVSGHTTLNNYNPKVSLFLGVAIGLAYGYAASSKDGLDKDIQNGWSSQLTNLKLNLKPILNQS